MRSRHAQITAAGFPYLVAVDDGKVVGYAYANHFRTRAAYRYTVEDSVYVAPAAIGRGVGKALLNELCSRCASQGLRQMLAVIGDSGNAGSIGVHRACGFEHAGVLKAVGRKFDRWVDVVLMQRALAATTARRAETRVPVSRRGCASGLRPQTRRCGARHRAASGPCRAWPAGTPMWCSG